MLILQQQYVLYLIVFNYKFIDPPLARPLMQINDKFIIGRYKTNSAWQFLLDK